MGFFGLFKQKPVQPKAPQFEPPAQSGAPRDLLDEFPDSSLIQDNDSSLGPVADNHNSIPDAPVANIEESSVPNPPLADSGKSNDSTFPQDLDVSLNEPISNEIVDASVDKSDNVASKDLLPDFSTQEIDAAKQLEQRVKGSFPDRWGAPRQDDEQTSQLDDDSDILPDLLTPASESDSQRDELSDNSASTWDAPLENLSIPAAATQKSNFTPSWSHDSTITKETVSAAANVADEPQQDAMKDETDIVKFADESQQDIAMQYEPTKDDDQITSDFSLDVPEEPENFNDIPEPFELPTAPEMSTQFTAATDSESQSISFDSHPWEQDPLPVLEDFSLVQETDEKNELFLPITAYKEALEHSKELKTELRRGSAHLSTTLRYMNQHKAKFSEFAEDLRAIEVDLLRMDEVLR